MFLLEKLAQYAQTDRIALKYKDATVSFSELDRRSDAFAKYLLDTLGDDRTPILMYGHKENDIPACMFGALKSGRGYVPVDTTFPVERVQKIMEELNPRLVVDFYNIGVQAEYVLTADDVSKIISADVKPIDRSSWVKPNDVCYILFTSGSTGKPKGVQITADNITAFASDVHPWLTASKDGGVFLNEISYSFDVSVCALYYALSHGMTLYTLDKATLSEPKALFEALEASNADVWVSTPSLGEICMQSERFVEALLPNTKKFIFCGEVLTKKLAEQVMERFPHAKVYNAYGPTEATVLVTAAEITRELCADTRSLPIGYAFDSVECRIADLESGEAITDGREGELLLIGRCVSPGYLARPDLNEKSFFTDAKTGLRGYRTGDLCYCENGMIYYCGRLDGQIKLNGFRVELEDVENNLVRVSNIARAAVVPEFADGKVVALTAFVMLEQPDGLSSLKRAKKIKEELALAVPSYMIPRRILAVENFPLNTNGKVDKKALISAL
ncbi:MAG: D-alanine--poly(phosphoribitol) ligase subunit DltA [Oscillospiraceae bacterium]|nr:D-alanine--poly(phosphoribitol) ligase subunit DltA [Oscillospiraceae bacterium]